MKSRSLWKDYLVENYIQHFYWHCVTYDCSIKFYTSYDMYLDNMYFNDSSQISRK